ncbi:glycosyltransferase family 9 protein [Hirschia litorea]|uniref:Glycosyltransferase family 9 protein n=1 Tax=Hirschia litorea TaxID=1199156 RepID=A0ABW2IM64_9PROT
MMQDTNVDFMPPENPGDKLRRVLVIQFGPMRTFLEGMAASAYVRRTHRSAHITLLTEARFLEFGKACPYFNDVEAPEERTRDFALKKLKAAKYEMVYDFQNDANSHAIAKSLNIKLNSSSQKGASHPYQSFSPNEHYTRRMADQLFCAGITAIDGGALKRWDENERPELDYSWIRAAFRNSPRLDPAFFNLYGRFALVIPGGPIDGSEDGWSPKKFGALCRKIHEADLIPVIIGNPTQGQTAQKIVNECEEAKNLISRADFFQMVALAQHAEFFVGGDTGPTYLTASVGLAGVAIFRQAGSEVQTDPFTSVWDNETRLSQYAPRGGNIIVNNAAVVDFLSPDDIWRSILALNVL